MTGGLGEECGETFVRDEMPEKGVSTFLRHLLEGGVGQLFDGEGGQDEHPFCKGGQNDGDHQNWGGGTWVAAGGFSGLRAEDADAKAAAEGGEGDCECFGSHGLFSFWLCFPAAPTVMPWSDR